MKQLSLIDWLQTKPNKHIIWNEQEAYRPYPVGKTVSYWTRLEKSTFKTGYLIQQNYAGCWYVFSFDATKTFSIATCTHIITFSSVERAKEYCELLLIEGEK